MQRPPARPGLKDGSGLLVWPLFGVIAGLIVYLIVLALPGVHNGGTVLNCKRCFQATSRGWCQGISASSAVAE